MMREYDGWPDPRQPAPGPCGDPDCELCKPRPSSESGRHRSSASNPSALGLAGWLLIYTFCVILGATVLFLAVGDC